MIAFRVMRAIFLILPSAIKNQIRHKKLKYSDSELIDYFCRLLETKKHISNLNIVFSKWSRKSYAIFASLKKVVKIARLSIDVCVSSLRKIESIILLLNNQLINGITNEAEQVENELLDGIMLPVLQPIQTIALKEHSTRIYKKNFYNNRSPLFANSR